MSDAVRLGFTVYPVTDIARAIAFYRDALGLGEATMMADDYAEFPLDGGAAFGLDASSEFLGIAPGSASGAAFEVVDYPAALERLRAHGATVGNEMDGPICRVAFLRDPDGNAFIVHRAKPR